MKSLTHQEEIIDKYSVIPIYYQLAKILEKCILDGRLKPGEALPPEHEIAEKYGISRMTVRRAISELSGVGMVYSQKGKGNFVSRPRLDDFVFELVNFFEEIQKKGMKPSSKLLGVKIVRADELLARKLEVETNTTCLYIRMVLSADDEPLVYENKYVIYTKQKPILETELKDPSLSNLASTHSDHFPIISKRVLQASIATEEEALILGTGLNAPVFVVEQTVYDTFKRPIGWGKSIYRGDRYKLTSYIGWSVDDIG